MTSELPPFEWTPYTELRLLQCMYGIKLHGTNRHFSILIIWEKFKMSMGLDDIPISTVKEKIATYYNLDPPEEFLSEQEIEFPQKDFCLPPDEFPEVLSETSSKKSK